MRLIDADKLTDFFVHGSERAKSLDVVGRIYLKDVIKYINEQPIVDAVEVVRCKNCVWNKQPQCPLSYTSPISEDGEVSVWYKNKGNDYCSYGKRKGGVK